MLGADFEQTGILVMTKENWRQQHAVLVPDAQALGMIGVIRSLGKAGYLVHASSNERDALGLASNFTSKPAINPPYRDGCFIKWLRTYVIELNVESGRTGVAICGVPSGSLVALVN